jgi:Fic family protein
MPTIEQKNIKNNLFFYLTEQVGTKSGFKKIQVYLGKSIPNNLQPYYDKLEEKEIHMGSKNLVPLLKDEAIGTLEYKKLEELKIRWKYFTLGMTTLQNERFWVKFAIQFIFESNAIEGSRLSEKEVSAIVNKRNVKKSVDRKEIREVENSLHAFDFLRSGKFKLNQRTIIALHTRLLEGLNVHIGYKKSEIIVNNKHTAAPGKVRGEMANLIRWFNAEKKNKKRHPLMIFADFHQRFEKIHPFEDGNGRTGRLLFNWMLFKAAYPPILFRKKNRDAYFNALNQADEGRKKKWHWHVFDVFKKTVREFLVK